MDQTSMLIAAVAALWGIIIAFAREYRELKKADKAEDKAEIAELKAIISTFNTEKAKTIEAKDLELSELRKLLITQYTNVIKRGEAHVS